MLEQKKATTTTKLATLIFNNSNLVLTQRHKSDTKAKKTEKRKTVASKIWRNLEVKPHSQSMHHRIRLAKKISFIFESFEN